MNFIERYKYLKERFNQKENCIDLNDSNIVIQNMAFESDFNQNCFAQNNVAGDIKILENIRFNYPVFTPQNKKVNDKAIILVHGLNEKLWNKYLTWAETLSNITGKSVILFPISFHMNRAPALWTDPREMNKLIGIRKSYYPDIQNSSFINLALSERLTSVPQRFFLSGYNYAEDLLKLIKEIYSGHHPLFMPGTQIDFFAYSIGVFLIQCLMIADREDLLKNSKYIFFAGGPLFCDMNGISKFIMDNKAFERIYHYYLKELEDDIDRGEDYSQVFEENTMGKAFRAMIKPETFRHLRDKVIEFFKPRILLIALRDDKIMPLKGIIKLYNKNTNIRIMHFKYPYIHESPFPVNIPEALTLVDKAFNRVFTLAASWLE